LARSAARLSAFTFASVAWTISSGTLSNRTRNKAGKKSNNRETVFPRFRKSTRHRRERSNRRKNSISTGKEAGVLEWVCNFESVTKSKILDVDSLIYEEDFDGGNPEMLTQLTKAHFELMVKQIKELDEYASICGTIILCIFCIKIQIDI